jgi:PPM family protein phosphatase
VISVLTFSELGGHRHNEDAFAVEHHPSGPDRLVVCLADGQGGQAGGAEAAQVACRSTLARLIALLHERFVDSREWASLLHQADDAVRTAEAAGFTTLIALYLAADHVVGASSGDSAVLVVDGLRQPHELTARQAKNPPVGSGAAVFTPFRMRLQPPWVVLVVSDGVWKYVGWEGMVALALRERGANLLEALQQAARLPGSGRFQDDFTVVLIEST